MELHRADLDADPLRQFHRWYDEARGVVRAPEAMALATADADGAPSVRMVLLKGADERGLAFYTHYTGRKGRELTANPQAALLFDWDPLRRQVRVEGPVERVSAEESDAYFATRPLGARIGAVVSRQSEVLGDRAELERRVAELAGDRACAAGDLGRLPPRSEGVGVLAAPRRPPARPLPLHAPRRRLGQRAALPVASDSASLARRSSHAPPTSTIHAIASPNGSGVTS